MVVRITELPDGRLTIAMSGGAGGSMSSGESLAVVGPGGEWRGWKYSRLRRLAGPRDVELVTKDQRRAADSVPIGGERPE